MTRLIDLTGKRFGRLTVVARNGTSSRRQPKWLCRCECGTETTVFGGALRGGHTQSCGCLQRERASQANSTHGETRRGKVSVELTCWRNLISRCTKRGSDDFENYGGRGIKVCDRWLSSFDNFLSDMGRKPKGRGISIDRIDNNGDYEPGNCRWATASTQQRNTRTYAGARRITLDGETHTISEWGAIVGTKRNTITMRLIYGWSEREAVFGR